MQKISDRLLESIKDNKISYEELSKISGVPKSAIQRYATGETEKLPIDRLIMIAKALNVSPAYLMGWEEEKRSPVIDERIIEAVQDNKMLYDFVKKVMNLTEEQQSKVLKTGLFLVNQEIPERD